MSYVTDRAKKLGLTVQDGRRPLTLAVTNNDIVNSLKANSKQCAFARAAQRIPNVTRAYFFLTTAYLEYPDVFVRYTLPPSVQKEIVSFDRAKMLAAGVYQLSPPGNVRARKTRQPAPPKHQVPSKKPTEAVQKPTEVQKPTATDERRRKLVVKTRFVRGVTEPA